MTEQGHGLSRLAAGCQDLGLDFDGGTKSIRQVRLGVEWTLQQQLTAQTFCLFGIGLGTIELIGEEIGPRHPGKSFHIVWGYSLLVAIALELGFCSGKVVLRQRIADIVSYASERNR